MHTRLRIYVPIVVRSRLYRLLNQRLNFGATFAPVTSFRRLSTSTSAASAAPAAASAASFVSAANARRAANQPPSLFYGLKTCSPDDDSAVPPHFAPREVVVVSLGPSGFLTSPFFA